MNTARLVSCTEEEPKLGEREIRGRKNRNERLKWGSRGQMKQLMEQVGETIAKRLHVNEDQKRGVEERGKT